MASPNGLQRLQIYNDASPNILATMPTEHSARLLNEVEMDFHILNNTMGFLLDNPSFGTIALPERLREMFNTKAAAEQYPYTFDETNESLLRNFARGREQGAPHLEDRGDLSEIKPEISPTLSNTEKQNREMSAEHAVIQPNSE